MKEVVIGSRGSALALWQAHYIQRRLRESHPEVSVDLKIIKTSGDRISAGSLTGQPSSKGLFVKEIEEALLSGQVDLAVHSLKDVPAKLPDGLFLAAFPTREDPRDVLVSSRPIDCLDELPEESRIATSSLRRQTQLKARRPDIQVSGIRGNVDTRLRKLRENDLDAVVLAAAGLKRLGLEDKISCYLSYDEMIPAIGQGALALEARCGDSAVLEWIKDLDDAGTRRCIEAERAFLERLGGDCQTPMGGICRIEGGKALFSAFLASPSSSRLIRRDLQGRADEAVTVALKAADELLRNGGEEIMRELNADQTP